MLMLTDRQNAEECSHTLSILKADDQVLADLSGVHIKRKLLPEREFHTAINT